MSSPVLPVRAVVICCWLLAWSAGGVCAQSPRLDPREAPPQAVAPPLRFLHYTSEDGLSQSDVSNIVQDPEGYLWFATADGLNRFDGYAFSVYGHVPFDPGSLAESALTSLYVPPGDSSGLLIGTATGGLYRLDRATGAIAPFDHRHHEPFSRSGHWVRAIVQLDAQPGVLWLGASNGLHRLDRATGQCTLYRHDPADPHTLSSNLVNDLYGARDGTLWIATDGGLDRLYPETGQVERHLAAGGPAYRFNRFFAPAAQPGVLWAGTGDGVVRFDLRTGAHRRFLDDPAAPRDVTGLAADPGDPDVLWAATGDGLYRLDAATGDEAAYRHVPGNPNSLSGDRLLALYADRSGILWAGVKDKGIDRFDPSEGFRHLRHVPGDAGALSDPAVFAVYKDARGRLWVGTSGGGLDRFDPATGEVRRWRHDPRDPHSLSSDHVRVVYEDPEGTLWVGTDRGLNRMDGPGRFTRYRHDPADPATLGDDAIRDLYASPSEPGVLWVATGGGGLGRLDTRTGRVVRYMHDRHDPASLRQDWLWSVFEDHAGRLWVGLSVGGLCRMDRGRTGAEPGAFTCYAHDPADPGSLSNGKVFAIHERAREPGILWLGTNGGGLNRFDTATGRATYFAEADGLPNNIVYAILEDEAGALWMSTNRGLSRFDPEAGTFRNFDLDSGIQGREFNAGAAFASADGELFFGGINGLTAFYPQHIRANTHPPQVALADVKLFNRSVADRAGAGRLALRHDEDMVTFDFVGLHFKNPGRNAYRYRLEGVDKDWIDAGSQRTATYASLGAGTYTFVVQAANSDGVWSPPQPLLRVKVHAPPWMTWWAYLTYALALAGGVAGFVQWRTQRLRRRQHEIAGLLEQRTADLQVEKRNVEQALAEAHRAQEVIAAQARQLQALDEAKSRFFANISHEFRTPLTLILGPLQLLLGGTYGDVAPKVREPLELMEGSARRLLRLINQILDLARSDLDGWRPVRQPQDLVGFVRRHVQRFAPLAELEDITLTLETTCAACQTSFDPDHLEEVVENLLSNAFKFTERGGAIAVTVGQEAGQCVLRVADTGVGIDPAALPHVFDRFFQAGNTAPGRPAGTGLGLYLVKRLVELHDGTIEVESTPGQGSTFTVHLPILDFGLRILDLEGGEVATPEAAINRRPQLLASGDGAETLMPHPAPESDSSHQSKIQNPKSRIPEDRTTVLVVEDHPSMRAYIRTALGRDFDVLEAEDGDRGLAMAREALPDLIVSDVMMPGRDGFELARALRSDPATDCIPIILLTARAASEDQIAGLALQVDDYLTKPFSAPVLRARVQNLIALRQHLRERYRQERAEAPGEDGAETLEHQARRAVEERLGDADFTVDDLASAVALSPSQLNRRLNEEAGCPASVFIRQVRLEHAADLLARRAGTVSEVAYAVGFNSLSYFARRFRERYGVSPSDYVAPRPAGALASRSDA